MLIRELSMAFLLPSAQSSMAYAHARVVFSRAVSVFDEFTRQPAGRLRMRSGRVCSSFRPVWVVVLLVWIVNPPHRPGRFFLFSALLICRALPRGSGRIGCRMLPSQV